MNALVETTKFIRDLYKSGDIIFKRVIEQRCSPYDYSQVAYHACDVECSAYIGKLLRCPNCNRVVCAKKIESFNYSDSDNIVICENCDYSGDIEKFITESCLIRR